MKCLLITSYFPPTVGGSAQVYGNLHKYGRPNISVLCPRYDYRNGELLARSNEDDENVFLVNYLQSPNVHCRNLLHSLWIFLRFDIPIQSIVAFKTLSLIYRKKFDVICIGDLQKQGWLTVLFRLVKNIKVVLFVHGEELTTSTNSRFLGKYANVYLKYSDGVITVSNFTKNIITNRFDVTDSKIKLVSNGIDLKDYQPLTNPDQVTKSFHKTDTTLIFGIGRLIERKGFDKAVDAIGILKAKGYDVQYVIAGKGEMYDVLKNKINDLGLGSIVTLIGQLSHTELISFYQTCDIFLMPNRELENGDTEGFGLVFLEANAFKKPVIGGNYGGAVDAIINEKTGLLVDSNSPSSIAEAIVRLIDNKDFRYELGENGYAWAKQNDVKNKAEEFLDYCESIVGSE